MKEDTVVIESKEMVVGERIGVVIPFPDETEHAGLVAPFPADVMDTSWMTKAQKTFFEVLKNPDNRNKHYTEILALAGYNNRANWHWYTAIKDERFSSLLTSTGIQVRVINDHYPSHHEVEYIKDPKEREEYFKGDVWDIRKLFQEYPRHHSPAKYILNFQEIENPHLRVILKRYYINMLGNWKPRTFRSNMTPLSRFFSILHKKFPHLKSLSELTRHEHIEKILPDIHALTNDKARFTITLTRAMFLYMYQNKWSDGPKTDALFISYDTPKKEERLPRPIPPNIIKQLDEYLEETIIPLLENRENTPSIEPKYWDMIIIIRYTGRRFEDVMHLLTDGSDKDCLRYDYEGDPQLYIDHRITKIQKDLVIPLGHLNVNGFNPVERAILRQKERVRDLLPVIEEGGEYKYLFREIRSFDKESNPIIDIITYDKFNSIVLPKVVNQIPLKNFDGNNYKISPHQFRHTVATEMIDAGVDIYAVKEFLGHSSTRMTEQYIQVYQQRLKKEFKEKLGKSDATDVRANLPEQKEEPLYDNQWLKGKLAVFDQGDGCCEHPFKFASCPAFACKVCPKRKVYPRHLQAVENTISNHTDLREQARSMGMPPEKIAEFDKVVRFYEKAKEMISCGEVFMASEHFYGVDELYG